MREVDQSFPQITPIQLKTRYFHTQKNILYKFLSVYHLNFLQYFKKIDSVPKMIWIKKSSVHKKKNFFLIVSTV